MKVDIELHESTDLPFRLYTKGGHQMVYSTNVLAVDETGDALAISYNFHSNQWEEVTGFVLDDFIKFKWFYVPNALVD